MDTPDRDDEPVESWLVDGRQCHVYRSADPVDGAPVWAGYARSKLPGGVDYEDGTVGVPGDLVVDDDAGWVGFTTSDPDRDAEETRGDVERLVADLREVEDTMDG